jgi:hypothetical protein
LRSRPGENVDDVVFGECRQPQAHSDQRDDRDLSAARAASSPM